MVSKKSRLLSLFLAVMMLLSVMTVAAVNTSAASGVTVYCENAANWSTVYCYMWDDSGNNSEWPGVQMTQGSDGLWAYTPTSNWNNIIFNAGVNQAQTGDMTLGSGNCFNNSTNSWTTVAGGDTPTPTTPVTPTPTTPVTPTPTPSTSNVVYCNNTANWGSVYVYMWSGSGTSSNGSWPGQKATNVGEGIWMLEYTGTYDSIIFNDGGSTQTGDLTHPGSGQCYDNSTNQWSFYDTSLLHIKSFTADVASPQYTGCKINLSAVAGGGEGALTYKFSVNDTVLSEGSATSTSWTPAQAGTYTLKLEVSDTLGETKSQTMSYVVKDIAAEVKPVIQNVEATPTNFSATELEKGKEATIDITAGGGNTGTKLLFYKVTITDPSGETANVPYYTLKKEYKFTPTALGVYSITASVQGSDNSTVTRTVEYECVDELSEPGELSASVSAKQSSDGIYLVTANAAGGTAPYTYEFSVNGAVVQAASDKNTYTLNASGDTNYKIDVVVKDSTGKSVTKSTVITASTDVPDVNPSELKLTMSIEAQGDNNYKVTATATGGTEFYEYQFAVNGSVVKDYSSASTATLQIASDGEYTIAVTVKDSSGATASATDKVVISGGNVYEPLYVTLELSVDDSGNIVAKGVAKGGEGNYLYQFSINGTVYRDYAESDTFTFSLPYDGEYDINVNVKDGEIVATGERAIEVKDGKVILDAPGIPDEAPGDDQPTTVPGGDQTSDYLKGDADCNGKVNIKDATLIQKYVAKLSDISEQGMANAEVDGNDAVNVKDATTIQKHLAGYDVEW